MTIIVNGEPRAIPSALLIDALPELHGGTATGIAVAINEDVVPSSRWASTRLSEGDVVDILTAVQGG